MKPAQDRLDDPEGAQNPRTWASGSRRAVGIKIAIVARMMRQHFDERVEQKGFTRAKWMLIAAVARQPGATQRTIASQLEVTDVTAGRLIDKMCAEGLLERRENPQDRRAYCVYLTDAARPLLGEMANAAEIYEECVFGGLDAADLAMLDNLLGRIWDNVAAAREDHAQESRRRGAADNRDVCAANR